MIPGAPTYILAAVGSIVLISIALIALYALMWVTLYATGKTIFQVRSSDPEWRKRRAITKLGNIAHAWGQAFIEGATWPADGIQCGNLSWKPLFQYDGFKRPAQKGHP